MRQRNPMAKDLRTSKYRKRVVPDKTKYKRKPLNDPFKELVLAMQKKTTYPDRVGKGVVKGRDVAAIRDVLNEQESSDA